MKPQESEGFKIDLRHLKPVLIGVSSCLNGTGLNAKLLGFDDIY